MCDHETTKQLREFWITSGSYIFFFLNVKYPPCKRQLVTSWHYYNSILSCFVCVCVCVCVLSHGQLFVTPWTVAHQAPLSMEFSRQEYWSGLPFPTPGDLLTSETEPVSLASPALASGFLTTSATWEAHSVFYTYRISKKNNIYIVSYLIFTVALKVLVLFYLL